MKGIGAYGFKQSTGKAKKRDPNLSARNKRRLEKKHSDVSQDKKLVKKMVKKDCLY